MAGLGHAVGHHSAAAPRTENAEIFAPGRDVTFGELLGQMLSVAVVLLGITAIMSWIAAIAR